MDRSQNLIEEKVSILHLKLKATFQLRIHLQTQAWFFNEKESKTRFKELSWETFKHSEFVTQPRLTNVIDESFVIREDTCKILHDLGFLKISETLYEAI